MSQERELTIERFAQGGRGVAHAEGKVVFVTGGLPGERVRARWVQSHNKFDEAVVVELLESPFGGAACPHFDRCGGCDWMRVSPDRQLEAKAALVRHDLERQLGPLGDAWHSPAASPQTEGYRCRITLKLAPNGVGYYAPGSHDLVPINDCLVAAQPIRDAIPGLVADASVFLQAGYSEIELRAGLGDTQPVGVVRPSGAARTDRPVAHSGRRSSALRSHSRQAAAAVEGPRELPSYLRGLAVGGQCLGDCEIEYASSGCNFIAGPHSFVQVNLAVNDLLVSEAVKLAAGQTAIVDAFCGIGNFSIPLAKSGVKRVFGMEGSAEAIVYARKNAEANGVNARWEAVPERNMVPVWKRAKEFATASLLVDPPRSGAKVLWEQMGPADLRPPVILYVSCEPTTLARDAGFLGKLGYRADYVRCFDMFPHTHHVETLVRFTR